MLAQAKKRINFQMTILLHRFCNYSVDMNKKSSLVEFNTYS